MKIHNIRYGFATNSSSTHSIILLRDGLIVEDNLSGQEFGWDFFTAASEDAKREYMGQQLMQSFMCVHDLPADQAALIASDWADADIDPSGYVDHQSVITFPCRIEYGSYSVRRDFFDAVLKFVLQPNIVIGGGSDNDDSSHPLLESGQGKNILARYRWNKDESAFLQFFLDRRSRSVRARFDSSGNFWSLFDSKNGTKIRFSFENGNAEKSEVPELVDIKITNYCDEGCRYCVAPDTVVLTKDLSWVPIKTLEPGQEIIAFDESSPNDDTRKLRLACITDKWSVQKPAIKVRTEDGEIVVSDDHRFLCGDWRWRKASNLRIGSRILTCLTWESLITDSDYWIGYINGMTAGDGSVKIEPTPDSRYIWWRIALTSIDALNTVIQALDNLDIPHNGIKPFDSGSPLTKKPMFKIELRSKEAIEQINEILSKQELGTRIQRSYKAGWLAGFYDAEGSVDSASGVIRLHQTLDNGYKQTAYQYLIDFGLDAVIEDACVRLRGGRLAVLKFFGITHPSIPEKVKLFDGEGFNYKSSKVIGLERLESQALIDITTTTKTFFANGMAVHNCYQGSTVKGEHASMDVIRQVMYSLAEMQTFEVALGGGEPTQHPKFIDILREFNSYGIKPNFSTRNADWVVSHWSEIKDFVGAVGLSVDDNTTILAKLSKLHGLDDLNLTIQVVVGACSEDTLKSIMEACKAFHVTVLLLGWKNTHRGKKGPIHDVDVAKVLDSFVGDYPWNGPMVAFDTMMVQQMKEWLEQHHANSWYFSIREGAHSMYIDCVTKNMAQSSYVETFMPLVERKRIWTDDCGASRSIYGKSIRDYFASL
jgi:hypothetical protein